MTTAQKVIKYCAIAFAVFLIVSIIGGIIGAVSSFSFIFNAKDAVGEMQTYAVTDAVENLEIDLSGAQLEVKTDDNFSVKSNHKYLKLENTDGSLLIKEDHPVFGFHSEGALVILTVPEDFAFNKVTISAGAREVKADTLLSEKLSLNLGAGEVHIDKLVATTRATINSGAGELNIGGGELADLDFDMGVGEANLQSRLTGDCDIDYGVGELNLTLIGTADDYRISLDKGAGKATLDGVKMSDDVVYGDGENSIEIDGGVGDMKIEFSD